MVVDSALQGGAAEVTALAPIFGALLVPLPQLTHKMRHAIPHALPLLVPSQVARDAGVVAKEVEAIDAVESEVITQALGSGPAAAVAQACRGQPTGLLRSWLSAIECREYVLPKLLLLR